MFSPLLVVAVLMVPLREAEVRTVPLEKCFASFVSGRIQFLSPDFSPELIRIARESRSGASNVFLVRGRDIREAIRTTRDVLFGARAVDGPVINSQRPAEASVWLVAYLGVGSSTPLWEVSAVSMNERTVRLVCPRLTPAVITSDIHVYCVWIPLGTLPEASYLLELYDDADGKPLLVRRVQVTKP
jgi:hypothetical protein